jgi:hypothetical protein
MVLDVAAYNKDIIADLAARAFQPYDPVLLHNQEFKVLTNLDFGNVRGLDIRLDRRFGNLFNGTVGYSYQQAKGTGSDPFTFVNFGARILQAVGGINGLQPPAQGINPTDNSRPHTVTGAFSLSFPSDWKRGTTLGSVFRNFNVFTTVRYTSGTAYSKCDPKNSAEESILSIENCVISFPEGLNSQRLPSYKELNARFTKSFGLGGLDVTGYLDVRNLLNFRNVIEVFAVNGDTKNDQERAEHLKADLDDLQSERDANSATFAGDGESIDLTFGTSGCGSWTTNSARPAAANCVYLIRAEERWGDGDHIFTVDEQSRAINALYDAGRGEQEHTAPGRRARLGVEINF